MNRVDQMVADLNPVPPPAPGHVTAAQERLLSSLVAEPRRRRRLRPVALVPVAAVIAAAVLIVAVFPRGTADEIEATAPPASVAADDAALIHVVTRLYGSVYGPGYGERLDGWLEPATGRVRIVITTGGEITLQQAVAPDDRFRSWQGALGNANGLTQDKIAPDTAKILRAEVRDRMSALIDEARAGFRQDGTTFGAAATEPGEYRGRAVTVHRIAPVLKEGGAPSGYYFKWYTDRETGEIIAFERGPVVDGRDTVETGEELEKLETFTADDAPLHQLAWQETPAMTPFPTATPGLSTIRPPARSRRGVTATPTPTPAQLGGVTATPTPTPAPRGGVTATPTPTPAPR
jgi:hypothetical protein